MDFEKPQEGKLKKNGICFPQFLQHLLHATARGANEGGEVHAQRLRTLHKQSTCGAESVTSRATYTMLQMTPQINDLELRASARVVR